MENLKFPKIGLRTIKSGIAVFLCLLLLPNEPFFACLTAVICLQDTVYNSIHTGINRGAGTILEALYTRYHSILYLFHNKYLTR